MSKLNLTLSVAVALTAALLFAAAAPAGVLYSEDFEVAAGTPLTDLGFSQYGGGTAVVADTPEMGLAFDPRGSGLQLYPYIDVPAPTSQVWSASVDMYVESTTNNQAFQIRGNTVDPRWAEISLNSGNWEVRLWDNAGTLAVTEQVLTISEAGIYNAKVVVDVDNLQMWGEVDGNPSSKLAISAGDLPLINQPVLADDGRSLVAAVYDNLLVQEVPEPTTLVLLVLAGLGLLFIRRR